MLVAGLKVGCHALAGVQLHTLPTKMVGGFPRLSEPMVNRATIIIIGERIENDWSTTKMEYWYFLGGCFFGSCISSVLLYSWSINFLKEVSQKYHITVRPKEDE